MSGEIVSGKGRRKPLIYTAGTPPTKIACAASGAYTTAQCGVIDVKQARRMTIWLAIDAAAIGNVLSIIPLFATERIDAGAEGGAPTAAADVWYQPTFFDGVPTAGTLTASSLSNVSFTVSPDLARCLHRAIDIRTEPADATTDKLRICIRLDVSDAQFVQILYAEAGVVGTPCSVLAHYSLGTG